MYTHEYVVAHAPLPHALEAPPPVYALRCTACPESTPEMHLQISNLHYHFLYSHVFFFFFDTMLYFAKPFLCYSSYNRKSRMLFLSVS